jgi:hypothetical protein
MNLNWHNEVLFVNIWELSCMVGRKMQAILALNLAWDSFDKAVLWRGRIPVQLYCLSGFSLQSFLFKFYKSCVNFLLLGLDPCCTVMGCVDGLLNK